MDEKAAAAARREKFARAAADALWAIDQVERRKYAEVGDGAVRSYIGASSIGDPCQALLALSLRGFPSDDPDAQLLRIFSEGHRMEPVVVAALRAAGLTVSEIDPSTGKQYHYEALGGHLAANLDGRIVFAGEEMGLEVKTMNRAKWDQFRKKGLEISHPIYFAQVQLGAGLSGLPRFLVVAFCKDNSQYAFEVVDFEQDVFSALVKKARDAAVAPQAERNVSWACGGCFKRTVCKHGWPPGYAPHCRNCKHSTPDLTQPGKKWKCTLHGARDVSVPCRDFESYMPVTSTHAITVRKKK